MRIKQASDKSGLSADTIRYYEKTAIIPPIARDGSGQRVFTKNNLDWMNILYWLRKTGMPMKVMARFAHLVHSGKDTIPERIEILKAHEKQLAEKREELAQCEAVLKRKLGVYENMKDKDDG